MLHFCFHLFLIKLCKLLCKCLLLFYAIYNFLISILIYQISCWRNENVFLVEMQKKKYLLHRMF